ncbi:NAD-dependent epimerase/dehydratase [Micromonospora sp. STR1_7]|uniref:NAD-dependent epimerase/dehydratase n=1 Tax=Micromonospora parastrephiae TaxID=2806101 RepID=A0ABS1XQ84_9ACTN|nr:NAD-dependent epimerase/dehydratase [Micromonospora parastrephiae]MBM0231403.1 NAD-dependent epimerase/dehydratase [Micromonospora parastrephiae]
MTGPRIALLGASGFIGSAVLAELARRPVVIRTVARRPVLVPRQSRATIEVRSADLTEPGEMAAAVLGADIVVHSIAHIAGSSSWRLGDRDIAAERVNVGLVRDLVGVLADRRSGGPPPTVVFAGAVTQTGPYQGEAIDGTEPDRPAGEYDRQKLAAESLLMSAHAAGVLRAVSLRLPAVFGPAPYAASPDKGVVSTMARRALAGEPLTMWHDGSVRRDLLFVADAARAFGAALDGSARVAGRHWVLGTGHGTPLGEVFTMIAAMAAEHTGTPPVRVVAVEPPPYADAGDFRHLTVDSTAFQAAVGWRPRVPLAEALRDTVAFWARRGDRPEG